MLKVGGENVDPVEVEQFLLGHPKVSAAAVVACPDERLSEVGVAFVVADGPDGGGGRHGSRDELARELVEFGRGRLASFKLPRRVLFLDALPMTSSGKVRKAELRELALATLENPLPP